MTLRLRSRRIHAAAATVASVSLAKRTYDKKQWCDLLQHVPQPARDDLSHALVHRPGKALIIIARDGFQIVAHTRWREHFAAVRACCERREPWRVAAGRYLDVGGAVDHRYRAF